MQLSQGLGCWHGAGGGIGNPLTSRRIIRTELFPTLRPAPPGRCRPSPLGTKLRDRHFRVLEVTVSSYCQQPCSRSELTWFCSTLATSGRASLELIPR